MAIGAVPSFRARGQVQEMGMAAAGSRLRGRGSHDGPARSLASVGHGAPFDVTPLGLVSSQLVSLFQLWIWLCEHSFSTEILAAIHEGVQKVALLLCAPCLSCTSAK